MKTLLATWILLPSLALAAENVYRPVATDLAAAGHSSALFLNYDARYVVFASDAPNLLPQLSGNGWLQLYRRDLTNDTLALVSVNGAGEGANGNAAWASGSSNGQFIAFITDAPNMAPEDVTGAQNLLLRDTRAKTTRLITQGHDGGPALHAAQCRLGRALLSRDGEWLFFDTTATNLTTDLDTNNAPDIFVHHRVTGLNLLVVKSSGNPAATPAKGARLMSITPDAARVAFLSSSANDLVPDVTGEQENVYVLDRQSGYTLLASPLLPFFATDYRCIAAAISENGAFVALTATADNHPAMLFRRDLSAGTTDLIASNLVTTAPPQISSDGQVIVFGNGTNVYRWDAATSLPQIVNITTNGVVPSVGRSLNPRMSRDGNHVSFSSDSPGLSANSPGATFQIYCRNFLTAETWLVTATTDGVASVGSAEFSTVDVSNDGGTVLFDSIAGDLVPDDANRESDVFIRRRNLSGPSLLSTHTFGGLRFTPLGHAYITSSCISSNGGQLAFTSWDSDMLAQDTNRLQDAFVADLLHGGITPLKLNAGVRALAISADGQFVAAYLSSVVDGTNVLQLSRFHLSTGAEILVNQWQTDYAPPIPAISSDGSLIAYYAFSGKFVIDDVAAGTNYLKPYGPFSPLGDKAALISSDNRFLVWYGRLSTSVTDYGLSIHDRATRTTDEIAVAPDAALSSNSRYLAYSAQSCTLRRDLAARTNQIVGPALGQFGISANGRFIVGVRGPVLGRSTDIVLLDCESKTTNVISVSGSGEPGNGRSAYPAISANGRYVAYLTDAPNIVPWNVPHRQQVVLRDVLLGKTTLLSVSIFGAPGNDHSSRPIISADGHTLVFQSMASDLTTADFNRARDIFIVMLHEGDTDGDGLDDDWEAAYFGNLSRNGNADSDSDGITDRDEFLAGTDPINSGSVFRVMTMARLGETVKTIMWTGNPSRSYRVEYKDDLAASEWIPLAAPVVWTESTARVDDTIGSSTRFYRVVRLP